MHSLEVNGAITPDAVKRARKGGKYNKVCDTPQQMVEVCRDIVAQSQMHTINGVMVDLFSASAIVKVYDALSEEQRSKLPADLTISRLASFAMKCIR